MKKIKEICDKLCRDKYRNIAIFFFFMQIIVVIRNLSTDYTVFFWFCDFAPGVYGVLFLLRKDDAVRGFVNIGLIPQIIFIFGIFYKLFFDVSLLGAATDSLPLSTFYVASTLFIHTSSIIALIIVRKRKPSRKTLLYSLLFLIVMYFMTLGFTSPEGFVNYVYAQGSLFDFDIPYYTYLWIPLTFIIVVLPTHIIQYIVWRIGKR